jgi:hypothetical protein
MLPPASMLAIKNSAGKGAIFFLALAVMLAGCTPPGPKALLKGRELIQEGRYPEAVDELKTATTLMTTWALPVTGLGKLPTLPWPTKRR